VAEKRMFSGMVELEEDPIPRLDHPIIADIEPKKNKLKRAEIKIPYPEIMAHLNEFKKERNYLIVCEQGVQSENVAFALRRKGIKALGISWKQYFKKK